MTDQNHSSLNSKYNLIVPQKSTTEKLPFKNTQEWAKAGNYFKKFSLFKPSSSGLTSANTSLNNLRMNS